MEPKRSRKIEKTGKVISSKMDKSRIVMIENKTQHPFYKKIIRKRKKLMVHDEANISKEGDVVKIIQSRPLSKRKNWVIKEVMEKGERKENGAAQVSSDGSG